jgi:phosphomethylpyrimidine synthase
MKITQDVRDYAATLNDPALNPHPEEPGVALAKPGVSKDEAEKGMAEMSEKFRQMGNEVYVEAQAVKEGNKGL